MHVSAVETGMAPDLWTAQQHNICDTSWQLDFGKLFQFAGGERHEVKRAVLFGSRPPPSDSIWEAAKRKGFEVVVYDRNVKNKEKKIDTDIVATMMQDSYELVTPKQDEMTLVAGDADYVPMIEKLKARGIPVHVCFWNHASREIRECATKFVSLNPFLQHLRFK
jgi:hypothetical protein